MMEEVKRVVNSWWFQSAATAGAGLLLWMYGHPLYAGIAFGWSACKVFNYMRS